MNLANKKKIDEAGNSDAGGDDKLNFFLWGLKRKFYLYFLSQKCLLTGVSSLISGIFVETQNFDSYDATMTSHAN